MSASDIAAAAELPHPPPPESDYSSSSLLSAPTTETPFSDTSDERLEATEAPAFQDSEQDATEPYVEYSTTTHPPSSPKNRDRPRESPSVAPLPGTTALPVDHVTFQGKGGASFDDVQAGPEAASEFGSLYGSPQASHTGFTSPLPSTSLGMLSSTHLDELPSMAPFGSTEVIDVQVQVVPEVATTTEPPVTIPVEQHEVYLANGFLLLAVLMILSLAGGHFLSRRGCKFMGLAGLATVLGVTCGAGLKAAGAKTMLEKVLEFNPDVFFFLLLPPIIFRGATGLDPRVFFKNVGSIIWLAVTATLMSFLVVAGAVFLCGQLQLTPSPWTMTESLAFATVISATDPVAVLAVLKMLPGLASPLLVALISGESLMNDAICLVLYRSIVRLRDQSLVHALTTFASVFTKSLLLGVGVGLLSALVYKYTSMAPRMDLRSRMGRRGSEDRPSGHEAVLELCILVLCVWASYLLAEGLELSGICAILFCGLVMRQYTWANLSPAGMELCEGAFETFCVMAETLTFVFLGLAPFSFDNAVGKTPFAVYFCSFVVVTLARLVAVATSVHTMNFTRTRNTLPQAYVSVLSFCGLRGSMALALAIRARHDFGQAHKVILANGAVILAGGHGDQLLATSLIYALFTVLVLGSASPCALEAFLSGIEDVPGDTDPTYGCCGSLKGLLQKLHRGVMARVFLAGPRKQSGPDYAAVGIPHVLGKERRGSSQQSETGAISDDADIELALAREATLESQHRAPRGGSGTAASAERFSSGAM